MYSAWTWARSHAVRYSSSITGNSTLTHLPYQLTYERQNGALTPVYEFPVTIEDEEAPTLDKRYDAANALVGQIAIEQGMVVVLMHRNVIREAGLRAPVDREVA